jgi:prepilin-type processing-associated H-X9-DG protein
VTYNGTSYLANHNLLGDAANVTSLAAVPQPARVIMFCDGSMNGQAAAPYYNTAVPNAWNLAGAWLMDDGPGGGANDQNWEAPSNRHNGMGNVAFVDGHVKTQMTESWWYPGSVNYVANSQ